MRPMRHILAAEPELARWLDRHRHEHAVLRQVKRSLPPALATHVEAAVTGSQHLVLAVTSGAAAALLRQHAPALLQALERDGCKFTVIKVRVQPRSAARAKAKSVAKQIDAHSAARLRIRGRALADPALREAVLRLAGRTAANTSSGEQPLGSVNEQCREQQNDRVLDDLADEPQVAAITREEVENPRDRDRAERDEQQQSDKDH